MEEEFVRRNTDCVYFLASPLTCKKGFECEYRHSETARLNPRDCWYWLAGNCLNPACGFRHPPLDGLAETAAKTAVTNHQGKTNVPCYFYYNSFCNKGDSCPFLHGPCDVNPSGKLSKTTSSVINPSVVEKTSVAADLVGPAHVETPEVKVVPVIVKPEKAMPEKDLHKSTHSNVVEQSASAQLSDSTSEGADVMISNSMNCRETEVSSPPQSTDQSTEDQEQHFGEEEWLESSPGFDVLVNDRTEELGHVTAAYLEHLDEKYREHNLRNSSFEYEDNVEYDPSYPEMRIPFQHEMSKFYDRDRDDKHVCNLINDFEMRERHRVVDNDWQQKMRILPAEVRSIDRSDTDLRDFLKRRRVVEAHYRTYSDYREQIRIVDGGRLHGRLESKAEPRSTGQKLPSSDYSVAKRNRQRQISKSRLNNKGKKQAKRQNILSEISGKKIVKKQRSYKEESSMFTGPKTLAEIKEEKKKQHK